nr:hypothetical protein [Providencia rettgeri]
MATNFIPNQNGYNLHIYHNIPCLHLWKRLATLPVDLEYSIQARPVPSQWKIAEAHFLSSWWQ